jgi:hypothetical protein
MALPPIPFPGRRLSLDLFSLPLDGCPYAGAHYTFRDGCAMVTIDESASRGGTLTMALASAASLADGWPFPPS